MRSELHLSKSGCGIRAGLYSLSFSCFSTPHISCNRYHLKYEKFVQMRFSALFLKRMSVATLPFLRYLDPWDWWWLEMLLLAVSFQFRREKSNRLRFSISFSVIKDSIFLLHWLVLNSVGEESIRYRVAWSLSWRVISVAYRIITVIESSHKLM